MFIFYENSSAPETILTYITKSFFVPSLLFPLFSFTRIFSFSVWKSSDFSKYLLARAEKEERNWKKIVLLSPRKFSSVWKCDEGKNVGNPRARWKSDKYQISDVKAISRRGFWDVRRKKSWRWMSVVVFRVGKETFGEVTNSCEGNLMGILINVLTFLRDKFFFGCCLCNYKCLLERKLKCFYEILVCMLQNHRIF